MSTISARYGETEGVNDGFPQITTLDGFHAWKHATRFGASILRAVTDDRSGVDGLIAQLAPDLAEVAQDVIEVVSAAELGRLAGEWGLKSVHHTRLVATARQPENLGATRCFAARVGRSVVFVDHPRHLGNLGAVIRAVAGAGGVGVLTTGEVDPWNPGVVRAAAGTHFALDVARLDTAEIDSIDGPIFGLDAEGENLFTYKIPAGSVIAVGAERAGLSPQIRRRVECLVSLPMRAGVSSLNLATSVAAALYVIESRAKSLDQPSR